MYHCRVHLMIAYCLLPLFLSYSPDDSLDLASISQSFYRWKDHVFISQAFSRFQIAFITQSFTRWQDHILISQSFPRWQDRAFISQSFTRWQDHAFISLSYPRWQDPALFNPFMPSVHLDKHCLILWLFFKLTWFHIIFEGFVLSLQ